MGLCPADGSPNLKGLCPGRCLPNLLGGCTPWRCHTLAANKKKSQPSLRTELTFLFAGLAFVDIPIRVDTTPCQIVHNRFLVAKLNICA